MNGVNYLIFSLLGVKSFFHHTFANLASIDGMIKRKIDSWPAIKMAEINFFCTSSNIYKSLDRYVIVQLFINLSNFSVCSSRTGHAVFIKQLIGSPSLYEN